MKIEDLDSANEPAHHSVRESLDNNALQPKSELAYGTNANMSVVVLAAE